MEISERSRRMFVQHAWINVRIIIVDIAAAGCLVNQAILFHILASEEDRQPFVVADLLVLSNVDLACLLEERAIVEVRIQCGKSVRNAIVLTQQYRLQNGQSRILVNTHIPSSVANLAGVDCITVTSDITRQWQPLGPVALLDNHAAALELTYVAVLLYRVAIDQ